MNVNVTLDMANINAIERQIQQAILKTANQIKADVQQAQTMPFAETYKTKEGAVIEGGNLQNLSTFVDISEIGKNTAYIVNDTPYARRLYFHPEFNFNKTENPNAGGEWFEPYISGKKADYAQKVFERFMGGGA